MCSCLGTTLLHLKSNWRKEVKNIHFNVPNCLGLAENSTNFHLTNTTSVPLSICCKVNQMSCRCIIFCQKRDGLFGSTVMWWYCTDVISSNFIGVFKVPVWDTNTFKTSEKCGRVWDRMEILMDNFMKMQRLWKVLQMIAMSKNLFRLLLPVI